LRTRIGRYRIVEELGRGGMGAVYLAIHDDLNRKTAIKTFLTGRQIGDDDRARLGREANAQARLDHPNIVRIYELEEDAGELFIAMEYVEGRSLEKILQSRDQSRMPWNEALPLFLQALEALQFVHRNGIVHRDVTPANLLIADGHLKLADFGISLMIGIPRQTRSVHGTPQYMAPEQFDSHNTPDHRTDIYSAGMVLFRMLAGHPAYGEPNPLPQARARLYPPPDLRNLVPQLPEGVANAVAIALQHDPKDRFQSALAFANALKEADVGFVQVEAEPVPKAQEDPESSRATQAIEIAGDEITSSRPISVVALIAIVVSGSAAYVLWDRWQSQLPRPAVQLYVKVPPATASIARQEVLTETSFPDPVPAFPPPQTTASEEPAPAAAQTGTNAAIQETRARDIEATRNEIDGSLETIPMLIGTKHFDDAEATLDRLSALAQKYPDELHQQVIAIRDKRSSVRDAIVAEASWQKSLEHIEATIDKGEFAEAQGLAKALIDDPRAPENVVAEGRQLFDRARAEMKKQFQGIVTGPTTNKIRKPSTQPRQ
jgi:serine/threonine protein kinase